MIPKKLVIYFLIVWILVFIPSTAFAAPNFYLFPSNGTIRDISKGFTVDVLLDSDGEEVVEARFAITYDPEVVRVVQASRNNSLFEQWPDDGSTIDNSKGIVMLTGFTQSGSTKPLYATTGEPDVMARIEFEVITDKKEDIILNFEYSGNDEIFKSVIMKDGSPPQNILLSKPNGATFTLSEFRSPSTAIDGSNIGIILGLLFISIGIFCKEFKSASF